MCPRRDLDKDMDDHIDRDEKPYSDDEEQFSDNDSFVTSPPRMENYLCRECENQTQCTDCFVRQTLEESGYLNSIMKRKLDFRDFSLENN